MQLLLALIRSGLLDTIACEVHMFVLVLSIFINVLCKTQVEAAMSSSPATSSSPLHLSLSSPTTLELTLSPSLYTVAHQLQDLLSSAQAAKGNPSHVLKLHQLLMNPATKLVHSTGCWIVNMTGGPLWCLLAGDGAAAGLAAGQSLQSGLGATRVPPSGLPLPLEMLGETGGVGSPEGRFMEKPSGGGLASDWFDSGKPAAAAAGVGMEAAGGIGGDGGGAGSSSDGVDESRGAAAAAARRQLQSLYVQVSGQQNVAGPVSLGQLGLRCHVMRPVGSPAKKLMHR